MASPKTLAEDSLQRSASTAFDTPFLMQLVRSQIEESEQAWPGFKESLCACAIDWLDDNDLDHVRRGIQSLAFVGSASSLARLQQFLNHPAARVSRDARTAIFEIEQRNRQLLA
jgi:hypothetical protein